MLKHFEKHGANVGASTVEEYSRKAVAAMAARKGRGSLVEGATANVFRFNVHGTTRYVDVDIINEVVISFGSKLIW